MLRQNRQETTVARRNKQVTGGSDALSRTTSAQHYAKKKGRRTRGKVIRFILVIVAIVVVAAAGAAFAYVQSLNTKLTSGVSEELKDQLTTSESGEPFYMLLLGTDRDEARAEGSEYGDDDSAYRSDSIMVVRVDPTNKKATLVSIHRDTLVDLGSNGQQKINAAYSIGGAAYATQVISEFAGVPISHYAEVDMDGMAAVVDEVGGIDVTLPIDVVDPNYTGLDLKAGTQHLDGTTAALLCRARHAYDAYGDGDAYRAANQRAVIEAVVEKVLTSNPVTMATTVQTMASYVRTDMDVQSIVALASQFQGMDVANDIYSGMEPTTSLYQNSTWYEICDVDAWRTMMMRVDQGLPPTEDGDVTDGTAAANDVAANSSASSDDDSSTSEDSSSTASTSATTTSETDESDTADQQSDAAA